MNIQCEVGEDRRDVISESIKSSLERTQSPYVDLANEGLVSLVGLIESTVKGAKHLDLFAEHNVLKVLGDKLYSRDDDLRLCAMTAVRALTEGGEVLHAAIVQEGTFFRLADASQPSPLEKCSPTPFSDSPFYHGRMDRNSAERQVGAMHPGAYILFTDSKSASSNNVATIVCLESLHGDGKSFHMEKRFSYDEILFNPDTKNYRLSSSSATFPSVAALVSSNGSQWTTPLMTSITTLLIRREALKALANICRTKSVVDAIGKFNVIERIQNAFNNMDGDDVVRRAAWEALTCIQNHYV